MILSLKGNRVVAESQNEEESVILLGLVKEIKERGKYTKECPVCHKRFKGVRIHARVKHGKLI